MSINRTSSESSDGIGPFMRESNTYYLVGKWWDDDFDYAYEIMDDIHEYNQIKWMSSHNHYQWPGIQAYTIMETLPTCEPWASFLQTYWRLIEQYIGTWAIQGSDVSIENVHKSLFRWEGHVGEVFREMRITMDRQKQGQYFRMTHIGGLCMND